MSSSFITVANFHHESLFIRILDSRRALLRSFGINCNSSYLIQYRRRPYLNRFDSLLRNNVFSKNVLSSLTRTHKGLKQQLLNAELCIHQPCYRNYFTFTLFCSGIQNHFQCSVSVVI